MAEESFGAVAIRHPHYHVTANVRASYDADPSKHGGNYLHTATLVIDTGAASVQVYATADQLRQMAEMFQAAADAVDAGVAAAALPEAA